MSSTGGITKRRAIKARDVRALRPSNMTDVSALSEILAPTRRAFVKLCGQLPPPASTWDSYNQQFFMLRKVFRKNWSRLYKDVASPDLPYAAKWGCSILDVYQHQQRSSTVLRAFEASESAKLDETIKRLRDTKQGPFSKEGKPKVLPDLISRRIINANKFCLNERTSIFERRPTFKGVHESQKWCLRRLHGIWKLKAQGITKVTSIDNAAKSPSDDEKKFETVVISIVEKYLDQYRDWLAKYGQQIWQVAWKEEITGREFTRWLAPTLYVISHHGTLMREKMSGRCTGSDGNDRLTAMKYGQDSQAFEQVQDAPFFRAIKGSNAFMGWNGYTSMSHEAPQYQ